MKLSIIGTSCPECGQQFNFATFVGDRPPNSGDAALCFKCGAINQFDEGYRVVPMPEDAKRALLRSEHGHRIRSLQIQIAGT